MWENMENRWPFFLLGDSLMGFHGKCPMIYLGGCWEIQLTHRIHYGIYANIWGILMVNVTIYTIHGSYGNN
jgi:hypothetical protein